MTDDTMKNMFSGFDPTAYSEEVTERWGETDEYGESRRLMSSYTAEDWATMKAEQDANHRRLADLMNAGVSPSSAEALEAAREQGDIINRWFYPLSPEAHVGLAEMYVADPRFEATYAAVASGLARYLRDAIVALHATE